MMIKKGSEQSSHVTRWPRTWSARHGIKNDLAVALMGMFVKLAEEPNRKAAKAAIGELGRPYL
jgi:hypothetical protein